MTYAVFHYEGNEFRFSERGFVGFPTDFVEVAHVEAPVLDAVFQLTNHIDSDWTANDGVLTWRTPLRSTSVGDVIVDGSGRAFGVAGIGFIDLFDKFAIVGTPVPVFGARFKALLGVSE